jgi:hypothetical protein
LTGDSSEYEREEAMKMRSVLPRAEEAPRVASALATLEEIEKVAAENKSWEDLSIVDKSVMEDLRDRVSFHEFLLLSVFLAPFFFLRRKIKSKICILIVVLGRSVVLKSVVPRLNVGMIPT